MLLYFAVTLFVSSALLFLVQPMIGKMILPRLGGTPAVWNTCMVFFQAALLVGYAYTHTVSGWRDRRRQLITQVVLLALPFIALPFTVGNWSAPQQGLVIEGGFDDLATDHSPVFSVLWLLLGLVGLPFFVVATSAPLLQKWFTATGHPAGKDPYFLYGASNLGSMLALVAYPLLIEPHFPLDGQSELWRNGYLLLAALVLGCAFLVWRAPNTAGLVPVTLPAEALPAPSTPQDVSTAVQAGRPRRVRTVSGGRGFSVAPTPAWTAHMTEEAGLTGRLRWLGLAGLPLALSLLVSTFLRTQTATHVLFWAVPGAVYVLALALVAFSWPWQKASFVDTFLLIAHPFFFLLLSLAMLGTIHAGTLGLFFLNLVALLMTFLLAIGSTPQPKSDEEVTMPRRLRWVALAAAPSSLMLGVTTYLTTDIAAIPLFWVIPLALYLLTFILVFMRWPIRWTGWPHVVVVFVQPFLVMALVLALVGKLPRLPSIFFLWMVTTAEAQFFVLHLVVFFATALLCHGELAKDRPGPQHLTEFYLWMSVGGVLGGMFNALVAPSFFWFGVVEYPLALLLTFFLRPSLVGANPLVPGDSSASRPTPLGQILDLVVPVALGMAMFLLVHITPTYHLRAFLLAVPIVLSLALMGRPLRFGLTLVGLVLAAAVFERRQEQPLFEDRSFFGFIKVREESDNEGNRYQALIHGGINHGWQPKYDMHGNDVSLARRREAITYFHHTGGIGQLFKTFSWPDARLPASLIGLGDSPWSALVDLHSEPAYGVVGLGIGTLAGHGRPLQSVTFYEIDPAVVRLSLPAPGHEAYFTYLQDAIDRGVDLKVILGDGRLSLKYPADRKYAHEKYYHILVLDAFSSDAIPVHLLTEQALDLYLSKLADGGVLVFNTTNRYVDIRPVLADLAVKKDLLCLTYGDYDDGIPDKFGSDWVILQRKTEITVPVFWTGSIGLFAAPELGPLVALSGMFPERRDSVLQGSRFNGGLPLYRRLDMLKWRDAPATGGRVWTDDYSNLWQVLNW